MVGTDSENAGPGSDLERGHTAKRSLGLQGWLLKPGMGFVARGYKARFVHLDLWGGEGAEAAIHFSKDETGAPPNGTLALKARACVS